MNWSNEITLLSAISASGKSTYAKRITQIHTNTIVVCADSIREELGDINDQSNNGEIFNEIMPKRISNAIDLDFDVIIDVTSPDKKTRQQFINLAKKLGVNINSVYILPDVKRSKRWNKLRARKIPEFVIDR